MYKISLILPLLGLSSPLFAAPVSSTKPSVVTSAKPEMEQIKVGELRLDGKISAILGTGSWQLNAVSWTSPRQVTTNFDEVKPKTIQLAPNVFIHPQGKTTATPFQDIKLKSSVAIIGKNKADGTLQAREVILLDGHNDLKSVGFLNSNPESLRLLEQGRRARDAGQLPKALALVKQAAQLAAGQGDSSGEILATQDVAIFYKELKQYASALDAFKHEQVIGEKSNNPLAQVLGLEGQGTVLDEIGQIDQAISLLERATALSGAIQLPVQIAVLKELVVVYSHAQRWSDAASALDRLFPLQENAGQYDDATTTLLMLASEQSSVDLNAAKGHLEQAQKRMDNIHDESRRLPLTVLLASALKLTGDLAGASQQYEAAAQLATAKGDAQAATHYRTLASNPGAGHSAKLKDDWTTVIPPQTIAPPQDQAQ